MKQRWKTLGLALALSACGAPRMRLDEAPRLAPAATPADDAALAWLQADARGLASAMSRISDPGVLAVLGGLRARDALDDGALDAALDALDPSQRLDTAPLHTLRVSFLPRLARARLEASPPRLRDDGQLEALGQVWSLTPRAPRPDADGLVVSVVRPTLGATHFQVRQAGHLIAFRGGRVVFATDPTRTPPRVVRFSAPGDAPLLLAWSSDESPDVRVVEAPQPAVFAPKDAPWARLVELLRALHDGDAEAATRALDPLVTALPAAPQLARLGADVLALDPDVSAAAVRDAQRAAWLELVNFAPARAHLVLGRIARQAGDEAGARAHLSAAADAAQGQAAPHVELFRLYFAQGWHEEAEVALEAAERRVATPCALLDERLSLLGARGHAAGRARMVERLSACERGREAAEVLLELDRPLEALARLDALGTAEATDRRLARLRFRALVALGRLSEARALADLAPPEDAEAALWRADLADPQVTPAVLGALTHGYAEARDVQDLLAGWPELGPFAPLILDTRAVVGAFERDPEAAQLQGPAVQVLDHGATLYFPHGRRLRWAHEIIAIRSREAAESLGELTLPSEARAVSVYTLKADGRRLPAEDSAEKESVSLPDLAAGDYVVAQYLEPGDNGYLYDSGFLTPRVFLQTTELPVFQQRFEAFGWDGQSPVAQRLADAAEPSQVRLGDRAGLRFEARSVASAPAEADSGPAALWLPSVRIGRGVTLAEDADYVRDRVIARRTRSEAFDRWVRSVAGDGSLRAQVGRLARAVRERIDGEVGLLGASASRMWQTGQGHRALVLSAALEAVGLAHRLVLARPRVHAPAGPFLQVADFPWALIEVDPSGEPFWVDPGPERAPLDFIPAMFVGGDALTVWPPTPGEGPRPLPTTRGVEDAREVSLALHWHADGRLTGSVDDTLFGQEAIVIGDYLARIAPEQRAKVVERLLVPVLGAAQVLTFDDRTGRDDPDGPLRLRATFESRVEGALSLGLFPVAPGRGYAALPKRTSPLDITLPTDQRVEVVITADGPIELEGHDEARALGGHAQTVQIVRDGSTWRVRAHVRIAGGLVAPEDYAAFASFAREVDTHEKVVLRRGAR